MSLRIVQTFPKLSPTSSVSVATTGIALRSGYLRVSVAATAAYVDVGNNPSATSSSFHIPAQNAQVFKERVARQVVAGIITGATTVIGFGENNGNPFTTNDYVAIENAYPAGINTVHSQVIATTDSSITINFNSSAITGVAFTTATVARTVRVSALGQNGSADVSVTEVQIAGTI